MAKDKETTDEPYANDMGLMLRGDPFGNGEHEIVGIANAGEWEVLEEDLGDIVDWATSPVIAGVLAGWKEVMIDHDDDRGETPTSIYSVLDSLSGERRAFYGNYQIDQALRKTTYMGRMVYIEHKGKRDQKKGGRTLNVFTILVKRAPVESA